MTIELKKFRKDLNMTQPEMAKVLGFSLSMYEKVERGTVPASRNFISALKENYPDVDIDYIFFNHKQQFCCCSYSLKEVK